MFARSKSRPRGRVRTLFLASFIAAFCFSPLLAQKPSAKPSASPTYDFKTEVKIKGTVDEVKLAGTDSKSKVTRLVVTLRAGRSLPLLPPSQPGGKAESHA